MPDISQCIRAAGENGAELSLRVKPRAVATAICDVRNGRLEVRLNAPPADGKANAALGRFLRKRLGVPKSAITIVRGEKAREKTVHIAGVSAQELVKRLSA